MKARRSLKHSAGAKRGRSRLRRLVKSEYDKYRQLVNWMNKKAQMDTQVNWKQLAEGWRECEKGKAGCRRAGMGEGGCAGGSQGWQGGTREGGWGGEWQGSRQGGMQA